jgi:hypothetical protein
LVVVNATLYDLADLEVGPLAVAEATPLMRPESTLVWIKPVTMEKEWVELWRWVLQVKP